MLSFADEFMYRDVNESGVDYLASELSRNPSTLTDNAALIVLPGQVLPLHSRLVTPLIVIIH